MSKGIKIAMPAKYAKIMPYIFIAVIAFFFLDAAVQFWYKQNVVAVVDGRVIYKKELVKKLIASSGEEELTDIAIHNMAEEDVKRANITVSSKDVDKEYNRVRKGYKTEEEFKQALKKHNITEKQLRQELALNLKFNKLMEQGEKASGN